VPSYYLIRFNVRSGQNATCPRRAANVRYDLTSEPRFDQSKTVVNYSA
jgi:hypothetical protein